MEEDSDDFGLGETGDLAIEHDDDFGSAARPQGRGPPVRKTTDDSLFGDGGDIEIDHAPPPARPAAPVPRPGPGAPSRRRGADEDLFSDDDRDGGLGGLLGDDDLGGDLEIDHDPGPPAPPPPRPAAPLPPPSRGPPSRRPGPDADLFSDDDRDDGLLGDSDLGGELEIDHGSAPPPPPPPRPSAPMPAPSGKFTDPEISLDANDAELADLLGEPQRRPQPSLPPPAPQSLPPRPPAPVTVSAPPPPDPASSFALGEEDDELAELLGDKPSRPAPPPPPPEPAPQRTLTRRVSFPDEPARPATLPAARGRPPAPAPDDDFADVDDGGGFGVLDDADREVARIASHNSRRGGGGLGLGPPSSGAPSFRSPAPQDSLADDFDSHHDELSFDARGPPPGRAPPPPAAPRRREGFNPYDDDHGEDSFDSPPGPLRGGRALPGPPRGGPPPRGIPPRIAESSELYGEDTYGDSMYDSRDDGTAGFRRMPAPDTRGTPPARQGHGRPQAPGPYDGDGYNDDYDDYAEDDDDWADDLSWDGEIRHTRGAYRAGGRPGSAGHPRSQGPHATGTRRRPLSAMAPRDRQAAMIEDMMSRHPSTWDIREVATWVEFIGMGQYRIKFVHHSIDGTLLLSLGEPELARDMRILPLGHRRALLGAIAELKEAAEAMEKDRADRGLAPGAAQTPKNENERLAELRRRGAQQEVSRRPASAGPNVIPPEPYLGPAVGKITVYEQRAKLLYQLDKARNRAAQHAAIIDQLTNNKQLTEQQMADLRGKLKDLEAKHKDVLTPGRPGMTASVGGASPGAGSPRHGHGTAALAAAEYGADAAVPWQPVGKGTRKANPNPERIARPGEDPGLDLTFRPRTVKLSEVPYGAVRDIVSKALGSRVPFWRRMDFEFEKARKEREAREEARRKRRERMGLNRRGGGGGEGEDEEQAKSKYWNNFWVPGSQRNASYHKHFRKGSENVELMQYRSFAKDKTRLARWFKRFIDDGEDTEGDVALERLVNRMIRALVKTKEQADEEIGETFDKKIRRYFEERGYKFATHTSNTIMVRARGTRRPAPNRPDNTLYDFEEVEQYYPDYLRKRSAAAQEDYGLGAEDEGETRMVPKRTTWKWLTQMYYMDRQKKLRAAIAMVKMSQFVQRHGVRWPPERDKANDKKAVWVPNSNAGALHQVDGRDRTFNTVGQDNIGLHAKLKKALGPPQPVTFQMKMKQMEATEAKADQTYLEMGWPHSSGDPALGPPQEPLLMPPEDGLGGGGGEGGDDFGLGMEAADGGGGGGGGRHGGRARAPVMDFGQAIDTFLTRALDLRYMYDDWLESWRRARERGYGEDQLPPEPPSVNDLDWAPGDSLLALQERAMERQRQDWLLGWEKARRLRDRRAARLRQQGYREADIEARLGKQQEAEEVESAVVHHLFINLTLMARHKPADLVKFREELAGTKKKMAVWRAICNQKFIDETREKEYRRESTLRSIYDSLRVGGRKKVLDPDQEDACVGRLLTDVVKRERRMNERIEKKLEAEESTLTPWYVLHPRSRPVSRAVSPNRDSVSPGRRPRSPGPGPGGGGGARGAGAAVTPPRPRSASRAGRAPTGPDDTEPKAPGDRRKYVFGSSTPKSMWGPMGPVRGGTGRTPGRGGAAGAAGGGGGSLLDSPALQGLTSGGDRRERSPGAGRGGSSTPTRHRPTTPSQPQRPRSAAPGPSPSPRPSGGGAPGPRRPVSAAGPAPPSPAGRGRPASPGPSRGPPVSPRRSTPSRVGFAPPPPGRGRSSGGGAPPPRRGLMDTAGDTDTSPERGPPRGGPAAQPRRGLADESESSPSPPPRRVPSQTTISAAPPAQPAPPPGSAAPPSRRSSQASGISGPAARPGSGGPGAAAAPPPPAAGGSGGASRRASGAATPPGGLSQQPSAASGLGMPAGPSRPGVPPGREPSGTGSQPRASGTGSVAGGGSNASGSRRPSNTPPAMGAPPPGGDLGGVGGSRRSLHSQGSTSSLGGPGAGGSKPGGSGGGGLSGGPSGASGLGAGGASSGGGSGGGAGTPPQHRSPLSRSPVNASPPSASPPAVSPRGQPSSLLLSSEPSNPPTAPPPAAAAAAASASGRPRVEPSTGGGTTDYDDDDFDAGGELDVEYELDEADGAELDMGDAEF